MLVLLARQARNPTAVRHNGVQRECPSLARWMLWRNTASSTVKERMTTVQPPQGAGKLRCWIAKPGFILAQSVQAGSSQRGGVSNRADRLPIELLIVVDGSPGVLRLPRSTSSR